MTAQIHETVRYKNREYSLVGVHGNGLFDPLEHGLKPMGRSTACYRGFQCGYTITDNELILSELKIYSEQPAIELFGVQPKTGKSTLGFFNAVYSDLARKIPFSGGLLIAKDFINELYVHMGFHPAWKYKEVHEIIFVEGTIQQEKDRSEEIAQFREDMKNSSLRPASSNKAEISKWIERCFSLDYKW